MNWLLVVVLVILAGHTIKGYRRGLLRVLFSVASLLITVLFVAWATPYVSNFLKENTKIYQKVETKCEQKVRKDTKEQIVQKEEKAKTPNKDDITTFSMHRDDITPAIPKNKNNHQQRVLQ